jgi:hypothetical protein
MAMRIALLVLATWLFAPVALAQETVPIPFAPAIPSTFLIDESRTVNANGVISTARARYSLDLRAQSPSYDAVLTLVSVEVSGAEKLEEDASRMALPQESLIGFPINLSLGPSGEPIALLNFEAVQQRLYPGETDYPTFARYAPHLMPVIAEPLGVMSPCQNTALSIGQPVRRERETTIDDGEYRSFVRTEKELRSVDTVSGRAQLAFTRVQGLRNGSDAAPLHELTIQIECTVDLHTGVVLSAMGQTTNPEGFLLRSEMSVTRQ